MLGLSKAKVWDGLALIPALTAQLRKLQVHQVKLRAIKFVKPATAYMKNRFLMVKLVRNNKRSNVLITSNTKKPFGGKVADIRTPSFTCFVSTAKDGLFKKQSMQIYDTSRGYHWLVAKLFYNDWLDSNARLGLHDTIAHAIDESGMSGVTLFETLHPLLIRLGKEGIGTPEIDQAWWNSNL